MEGVVCGEAQIRSTKSTKTVDGALAHPPEVLPHRGVQPPEAVLRERAQEVPSVGEVMVRRGRRNPEAPSQIAKAERGQPALLNEFQCLGEQRFAQIAVMVGAGRLSVLGHRAETAIDLARRQRRTS